MSSFWIWHSTTPYFSPRSRSHTTTDRTRSDSMGFWPENLLLLEPTLLQLREGSEARIGGVRFTTALFVIQVGAAAWTQPPAIALAYDFHRQRQQHLFLQHIGQEQAFSFKKSDLRVVVFQPLFFVSGPLWERLIE